MSAVKRPISEVGPVERSTEMVRFPLFMLEVTAKALTFRSTHEGVQSTRQPAGHEAVLDGNGGQRRIGNALGDEHETQRQPRDNIVDDPSRVVMGQPAHDRDLVDEVPLCGRRQGASAAAGQVTNLLPSHIRPEVVLDAVDDLHGEEPQEKYMPNVLSRPVW